MPGTTRRCWGRWQRGSDDRGEQASRGEPHARVAGFTNIIGSDGGGFMACAAAASSLRLTCGLAALRKCAASLEELGHGSSWRGGRVPGVGRRPCLFRTESLGHRSMIRGVDRCEHARRLRLSGCPHGSYVGRRSQVTRGRLAGRLRALVCQPRPRVRGARPSAFRLDACVVERQPAVLRCVTLCRCLARMRNSAPVPDGGQAVVAVAASRVRSSSVGNGLPGSGAPAMRRLTRQ